MPQVEVMANDFVVVVVGKDDTIEEANSDHDKNLVKCLHPQIRREMNNI